MVRRNVTRIATEIPGPKSRHLYAATEQNVPRGVGHQTPIAISKAKGAIVTDVNGNKYLDFAGGIGTLNIGHCPEEVVTAIKEQSDSYLHACFDEPLNSDSHKQIMAIPDMYKTYIVQLHDYI